MFFLKLSGYNECNGDDAWNTRRERIELMSTGIFIKRFYCAILYFLILAAFVLIQAVPAAILLPAIVPAAVSFLIHVLAFKSCYLSVMHSVCGNE